MRRLFGAPRPTGPQPTLQEAAGQLSSRIETLDGHIAKCDVDLKAVKAQLARCPANASLRSRGVAILKRKKMYEAQRDQIFGTQFNIEQTQVATEQLQATVATVGALQTASTQLRSQFKQLNINKIQKMQDEMEDLLLDQEEVTELLSRNYTVRSSPDSCRLARVNCAGQPVGSCREQVEKQTGGGGRHWAVLSQGLGAGASSSPARRDGRYNTCTVGRLLELGRRASKAKGEREFVGFCQVVQALQMLPGICLDTQI
eukprot:GHVT01100478.1.p1 GENE.GHVT01100478.1~~GHVT01100478.1.p1  ORF type:complete len:258 (-),score=33.48 GHVT01100478.1:1798-2571(-)